MLARQPSAGSASLAPSPVASSTATSAGAGAAIGLVDTPIFAPITAPTMLTTPTGSSVKPAAVAASPLAPAQLATPEVIPSPVTAAAATADAGSASKKTPVIETPVPIPASSIRFPTVSTPVAAPAAAVTAAVTAVQTPDTAITSPVAHVAGKESMMREMLLKKRQGGAMGGKRCLCNYTPYCCTVPALLSLTCCDAFNLLLSYPSSLSHFACLPLLVGLKGMAAAAGEPSAKKSKTQEPAAKTGTYLLFYITPHHFPLFLTYELPVTVRSLILSSPFSQFLSL